MARRTAAEIFTAARAAGLSVAAATIATAIGLGESSGDDKAVGDTNLQTSVWGPSVGVWQIRTLKAETGTGSDRDINVLQGNLSRQAQAMNRISANGTNWTPWTVFTKGKYQQYMGQAQQAAGTPVNLANTVANPVTDTVDSAVAKAMEAARAVLLKSTVLTLGVVLIGVGVVYAVKPGVRQALASKKAGEQKMRSAVGF